MERTTLRVVQVPCVLCGARTERICIGLQGDVWVRARVCVRVRNMRRAMDLCVHLFMCVCVCVCVCVSHVPGLMESTISLVMSRGAFLPGMSAVLTILHTHIHTHTHTQMAIGAPCKPAVLLLHKRLVPIRRCRVRACVYTHMSTSLACAANSAISASMNALDISLL